MKPATMEAARLMHDGSIVLSELESNGIKVDVEYLRKTMKRVKRKVERIEEDELKTDELWKDWERLYGTDASLTKRKQLVAVLLLNGLVKDDKYAKRTARGDISTDKDALLQIDHPFIRSYLAAEQLRNLRRTFLKGAQNETTEDGLVHGFFNLHIPTSYRSSSDSPNLQNIPIRDEMMSAIIRKAFIPRAEDRCIVEIDYSGVEVRVSACYNHDPVLIRYIEDPTTDMHRDMAAELFFAKQNLIEKNVRHASKNQFVFPQFYGSYYKQCAPALWQAMERHHFAVDGVPMRKHLKAHGIKARGECDPDDRNPPLPGTFEAHVRDVERGFWNDRFVVYKEWKNKWFDDYIRKGGCRTLTGFVLDSILNKKEVSNLPIQGSAFHCLLWSLIRLHRKVQKTGIDALLVSQIHDSIIADVHRDHVADYVAMARGIMVERIAKHWPWLIVPLSVEVDVAPPGMSWHDKKGYHE